MTGGWECLNNSKPSEGEETAFINCSFYDHYNKEADWSIGWKTALFSTLMLVSLIANASVIFTLSKFKQIRTATNIFIGSLACADICKCFSNAVFGIVLSYGVQDYVLGSVWCENEHFIKASKNIVTNMSIIAMVAGRLGSVLFAGQPLFRSVRAALISAIMMWILCVPSMYFLVRVYWKTQMHEIMWKDGFVQHVCLERNNGGKVFWIVLLFVQRYVPLILLLILYAVVWRLSRVYAGIQIQQPNGRHYLNNGILLVYVLIGIVLQIPSQVYFFMRMRDAKSDWHDVPELIQRVYLLSHVFSCLDTCVDPFIFAFATRSFRHSLLSWFTRMPTLGEREIMPAQDDPDDSIISENDSSLMSIY